MVPVMPLTTKDQIVRVRQTSDRLLDAPGLPVLPRRWQEVRLQVHALRPTLVDVTWATQSNSGLFGYSGAVLGARQWMVHLMQVQGFPPLPGFADLPPRYLATMATSLALFSGFDIRPVQDRVSPPLTQDAKAVIDLWEDAGLGPMATPAFHLSHVYYPSTQEWGQVGLEAETGPEVVDLHKS